MDDKVNLLDGLARFEGHWQPRIVAMLNDYKVLVVKVQNEFVWHAHAETDDFFLVVKGHLTIQLRDRDWSSTRESCSSSPAGSSTARGPTRRHG